MRLLHSPILLLVLLHTLGADVSGEEQDGAGAEVFDLTSALSPETARKVDAAVDRGVKWLATQQNADGSMQAPAKGPRLFTTAYTALAFLSAGHQPGQGKYGQLLARATDYLFSLQHEDGYFSQTEDPPWGRDHATVALSLCALYGTGAVSEERLRDAIERAVAYSGRSQNKLGKKPFGDGGWIYGPPRPSNMPPTAYEMMFLRAAADAGFEVPQAWIDDALTFITHCYNAKRAHPDMGVFVERVNSTKSRHHFTPMALLALQLHGRRDDPMALDAVNWLAERPLPQQHQVFAFYRYHYVSAQAMARAGGEHWLRYFPRLVDTLSPHQAEDGRWGLIPSAFENRYGDVCNTALAVLMLTLPDQLLPIHQR